MKKTFSKDVAVNHYPFTFHFRPVPASYPAYQVDVTDEKGVKITFSMIRPLGGPWRATSNRLPLWIGEVEGALAAAIEEQEIVVS
jgi:hypothetical protein